LWFAFKTLNNFGLRQRGPLAATVVVGCDLLSTFWITLV